MPFPGFMAIWCFSLISQRANIKESVSLCSPHALSSRSSVWAHFSWPCQKDRDLNNFFQHVPEKTVWVPPPMRAAVWAQLLPNSQASPGTESPPMPSSAATGSGAGSSRRCPSRKPGSSNSRAGNLLIFLIVTAPAKEVWETSQWCCVSVSSTD